MKTVGTLWLIDHFKLPPVVVSQASRIGSKRTTVIHADGRVDATFPKSYWPGDQPLDHVTFALKYEPVSLDLLHQVFRQLPPTEVDAYIARQPTSKYARRIGYLYEQLTAEELHTKVQGNFVPVLDAKRYFVGKDRRIPRWRVRDNLLGSGGFCPIVRRTPALLNALQNDFSADIRKLSGSTNPALLARAISYLYRKETKASFEIEQETVGGSREDRFLRVLASVGETPVEHLLDENRLVDLQNMIVDSRYADSAFRTEQNYVGQVLPNLQERIHYICPPPLLVRTLMAGLRTFLLRSVDLPSPIRAAVASFGFVYVHPFEDGNGRIHRLLLHETLAHDGFTDKGIVLPLSAGMLRDPLAYDRVLEGFSNTVLGRVQYEREGRGHLTITNPNDSEGVWRFPDLTAHAEYVLTLIEQAVRHDLPTELDVLQRFDSATRAISEVVDLPNRKQQLILKLLHQNGGRLSQNKRHSEFSELTDAEVTAIEDAFQSAFDSASADAS